MASTTRQLTVFSEAESSRGRWNSSLPGTILVHELPATTNNAVLYASISSMDQAADLDTQVQRPRDYAAVQGLHVVQEVKENGSWLNGHRKKLMKVLENTSTSVIVVERRDRLARFGSEYVESAMAASKRKVVIVNDTEMKDDLVQDMVDVLTSFCTRLYGKQSAKNKAKRTPEATER